MGQQLDQARQDLKAAQDENAELQQRLDQAVAEVDDLRKQLQAALQQRNQALAEADQARQQAVAMQDTLDHFIVGSDFVGVGGRDGATDLRSRSIRA